MKKFFSGFVTVLAAIALGLALSAPAHAGGLGMQIYISLPGTSEHLRLDVEGSDSIVNVKQKIQDQKHYDPATFYLVAFGSPLDEQHILDEYNIQPDATLHLFFNAGAPAWSGGTPALTCGTAFSRSIATTGTGVQFGITGGALPSGLSLNGLNGVISGTPTTAGHYSFRISANNDGSSARTTFTGAITCGLPNTGRSNALPALFAGLGFLFVGAAIVVSARRRHERR